MPIVSDMVIIQDFMPVRIGDNDVFEKTFNTGGLSVNGQAILTFMVKGLTATRHQGIVRINGEVAERISSYKGLSNDFWFTQTLHIRNNYLNNGDNEIKIETALEERFGKTGWFDWMRPGANDIYDDIEVRNVFCHFQKEI